VRYLVGTVDYGITYRRDGGGLSAMCDSDWAGCPDTRRSTTGFKTGLAGGPLEWSSHVQRSVALSSLEAEFSAANSVVREIVHERRLLHEIGLGCLAEQPVVEIDNDGCIAFSSHETNHSRTKHIDTQNKWMREQVEGGVVKLVRVGTHDNTSDIYTKALASPAFEKHRNALVGPLSQ
jgi:hypothetical protein